MNNMIAMGAQGPNVRPARNRAAAMQNRNAMMESQAREMQMAQQQQAMQAQNEIRNALAANPNATPEQVAGIYMQHGMANEAFDLQDRGVARQAQSLEMDRARGDLFLQETKILSNAARQIRGPEDFPRVIGELAQQGTISEDRARQLLTRGYSPEFVQHMQDAELTAQQIYDRHFGREQFDYQKGQDAQANRRADRQLAISESSAAASANDNDLKRQELELKLEEKRSDLNEKAQSKEDSALLMGEAYEIANDILTNQIDALTSASGVIGSRLPTMKQATANVEIDLDRLATILTKDNLKLMTGILTDNDIKFLGKISAGGLNLRQGDKKIVHELTKIAEKLKQFAPQETEQNSVNTEPTVTGRGRNRSTRPSSGAVLRFDSQGNPIS